MSWLWGGSKKDATSGLDSGLQEYLKEETRRQQQEEQARLNQNKRLEQDAEEYKARATARAAEEAEQRANAKVPPQSQFQDGRYAELWKNYRSEEQIVESSMTSHDYLTNVLQNYKDRQAAIGRAAIENCVVEQLAQRECFMSGSWSQLATMCRTEARAFNRCYEMQGRFLKALGYLSVPASAAEEERIQMHADKLYHQMLEREKQAGESSTSVHTNLIPADEVIKALGENSVYAQMRQKAASGGKAAELSDFNRKQQREIVEKLRDMTEAERAVELQMLAAEKRADRNVVHQLELVWAQEKKERAARRDKGEATVGDRMKEAWGWEK